MSGDPSDRTRSTAVKQLEAFGLSTSDARTFVALVSLGEATTQDASDVTDIPRTASTTQPTNFVTAVSSA